VPNLQETEKITEVIPAELVREPLVETIRKAYPDWSSSGFMCLSDLNQFRAKYVEDVLEKDKGELSALEDQVVKSLKEHELVSSNINAEFDRKLTLGERLADKVADYGGSWRFIGIFMGVLLVWIVINSVVLITSPLTPTRSSF
jgi:hypothetical protein